MTATLPTLEPLDSVDAGVLAIAYHQAGPVDGPPVLLMHGFPYDIHAHSHAEVVPQGLRNLQGHAAACSGRIARASSESPSMLLSAT